MQWTIFRSVYVWNNSLENTKKKKIKNCFSNIKYRFFFCLKFCRDKITYLQSDFNIYWSVNELIEFSCSIEIRFGILSTGLVSTIIDNLILLINTGRQTEFNTNFFIFFFFYNTCLNHALAENSLTCTRDTSRLDWNIELKINS